MEDDENSINGSSTFDKKKKVLLLPEMSNGSDFYLNKTG